MAIVVTGVISEGGGVTIMGRVVDATGVNAVKATFSTIEYETWDITAVAGGAVPTVIEASGTFTIADVMYDTLQTGDLWTVDDTGYNFLGFVPASDLPTTVLADFPKGVKACRCDVKFTDSSSRTLLVPYEFVVTPSLFGK